jgi:uncharacterized protein (TIGR03435 family)
LFLTPLLLIVFSTAFAQTPAPEFDAASVEPAKPDVKTSPLVEFLPGGVRITNATLVDLIETGYQLRMFQITGGPSWIRESRYDVTAKAAASSGPSAGVREMVQALLNDRFQLQIHRETRNVPIYSLTVAKNGLKTNGLRVTNSPARGINAAQGSMLGEAAPMTALAMKLSNLLGRPVINNTGLEGNYDFKLQWTPDRSLADSGAVDDSLGPSLFTALQEQLGLRLDSARGPAEVLVVDRAEKPSEN